MLYVKIMSGEDMPDTDPYKNYAIVPVERNEVMRFVDSPQADTQIPRRDDEPRFVLEVHGPEGGIESHPLTGNAYVMTENGKTISSHAA